MTDLFKCENAARELLIKQASTAFATDVKKLDLGVNVHFDTFLNYSKITGIPVKTLLPSASLQDGYTVTYDGGFLVLTDRAAGFRTNWTLAHEVGHIALCHRDDGEAEEREANRFASELLMPEPILFELAYRRGKPLNAEEISRLFAVSESAAECRISQLSRKKAHSGYLRRELTEKYRGLIDGYVKNTGFNYSLLIRRA